MMGGEIEKRENVRDRWSRKLKWALEKERDRLIDREKEKECGVKIKKREKRKGNKTIQKGEFLADKWKTDDKQKGSKRKERRRERERVKRNKVEN